MIAQVIGHIVVGVVIFSGGFLLGRWFKSSKHVTEPSSRFESLDDVVKYSVENKLRLDNVEKKQFETNENIYESIRKLKEQLWEKDNTFPFKVGQIVYVEYKDYCAGGNMDWYEAIVVGRKIERKCSGFAWKVVVNESEGFHSPYEVELAIVSAKKPVTKKRK